MGNGDVQVRVQKAEDQVYAAIIGELDEGMCFIPKIAVKVGPGSWSPQTHDYFEYGGTHLAPGLATAAGPILPSGKLLVRNRSCLRRCRLGCGYMDALET